MLLTTSLPLFAPPPASLLPSHSVPSSEAPPTAAQLQQQPHQHSRRSKQHASALRNSTLAVLSSDERTIAQRKMAIAMYGYGWLKPAGCAKTMLGRREEDVEREEVERQLREVEMQERAAQEAEDQERQARLAETGEPDEGRDLDEDIPDMDAEGLEDEDDDEVDLDGEIPDMDGEEDEEGMEGDLDDDIPEADDDENDDDEAMSPDPDGIDSNWVYDSRREPDTDDEMQNAHASSPGHLRDQRSGRFRHGTAIVAGVRVPVPGSEYDYDEREAEDLANAMLDEDEIFDDEDEDEMALERDLDDDVPEAGLDSEQGWEHTDTELEDSEMDISILPPSALATGRISGVRLPQQRASLAGTRRSDARVSSAYANRRSSGPWITGPSPAASHPSNYSTRPTPDQQQQQQHHHRPQQATAPRARMVSGNQYRHTPDTQDFSAISHQGGGDDYDYDEDEDEDEDDLLDPFNSSNAPQHQRPQRQHQAQHRLPHNNSSSNHLAAPSLDNHNQHGENPTSRNDNTSSTRNAARSWLDGAAAAVVGGSARRTLFGRAARRGNDAAAGSAAAAAAGADNNRGGSGGASSGGLFTPSPFAAGGSSAAAGAGAGAWDDTPVGQGQGQGEQQQQQQRQHQRRRSGRFLAGRRRGADVE